MPTGRDTPPNAAPLDTLGLAKMVAEHGAQRHIIAGYEAREAELRAALKEIERIVGDTNTLSAQQCDLIRGVIASVFYRDINGG